jgi:hypothetical protein
VRPDPMLVHLQQRAAIPVGGQLVIVTRTGRRLLGTRVEVSQRGQLVHLDGDNGQHVVRTVDVESVSAVTGG